MTMIMIFPAINEELSQQICIIYCSFSFSSRSVRTYVLQVPKFQNFDPSENFLQFFVFSSVLLQVVLCRLWIENTVEVGNGIFAFPSLHFSKKCIIAHRIIAISSPIHHWPNRGANFLRSAGNTHAQVTEQSTKVPTSFFTSSTTEKDTMKLMAMHMNWLLAALLGNVYDDSQSFLSCSKYLNF